MCVSCMDFVSLIHDENNMPDPLLAKPLLDYLRQEAYSQYKTHMTDEQAAVFMILLGGNLLCWEDTRNG